MADEQSGLPAHSPVHESPDGHAGSSSGAASGQLAAQPNSPTADGACSHLRGKSVSLSGFSHPMCNGTYTLASTSCGWPRFTNRHGLHLYYQVPTDRWCLNVSFPSDTSVLTCSARQVEAAGLPDGEQAWIEACRTEDGGSEWLERQVVASLVAGFSLGLLGEQSDDAVIEIVAEVVSGMTKQLEAQAAERFAVAQAGAGDPGIWSDTAPTHGGHEDLTHVLYAMVDTLQQLHSQMVLAAVDAHPHRLRGDFRLAAIVDAVEEGARRENEMENASVFARVQAMLASVVDENSLLSLPVELLVPAESSGFLLQKLVPTEHEWIGRKCVRVFGGLPIVAKVVGKTGSDVTGDDVKWSGYTLEHADGDREDLVTVDVRAALMLGQVIAVRKAQKADSYPVGTVLQLQARVHRTDGTDETLASIACSAQCDLQELLELNASKFTHLAGQEVKWTTEHSKLSPGTLVLVPHAGTVLRLHLKRFVGWSALAARDGECCWPQWLVADETDPQMTMRCCPPACSREPEQPKAHSPPASSTSSPSTAADSPLTTRQARQPWAVEEDAYIRRVIAEMGQKDWSMIAKGLPGRNSKQCRERWNNQLCPNIKRGPWSDEEERILATAHAELGNSWSEISQRLPGRTDNGVKNHWNSSQRRQTARKRKVGAPPEAAPLIVCEAHAHEPDALAPSQTPGGGGVASVARVGGMGKRKRTEDTKFPGVAGAADAEKDAGKPTKVQRWIYLEAPEVKAIPTGCAAERADTIMHNLCNEIVQEDFRACLPPAPPQTEPLTSGVESRTDFGAHTAGGELPWAVLWKQLHARGWLVLKYGAMQRSMYLLPEHEVVSSAVDSKGRGFATTRAADGSQRQVLRTQVAVRQHYAATLGAAAMMRAQAAGGGGQALGPAA